MNPSQLPSASPELQAALERAALNAQSSLADWKKYFCRRMTYDEYKFIGYLNDEMCHGRMAPGHAWNLLTEYRKTHKQA